MVKATRKRRPWHLPKTIETTGLVIPRQQERDAKERKRARLAAFKKRVR